MPTILIHPAGIDTKGGLDKESIDRVEKGFSLYLDLLAKGEREIYFVSSVKDRLKEGYLSQSEMIREFLLSQGVGKEKVFISNKSSNTLDDIWNSIRLLEKNKLPLPLISVSSWYHIPRIWLMFFLLRKEFKDIKTRFICSKSSNLSWAFLEPIKTIRLLKNFYAA